MSLLQSPMRVTLRVQKSLHGLESKQHRGQNSIHSSIVLPGLVQVGLLGVTFGASVFGDFGIASVGVYRLGFQSPRTQVLDFAIAFSSI